MQFWQALSFVECDQLAEITKMCEEVGFDGVLLPDHLFFPAKLGSRYPYTETGEPMFDGETPFPDCWVTIGMLSVHTRKLRFTTGVHILPLRHPVELAKAAGSAAVFAGDRVYLGAGAGWMREEFDAVGVDFKTRGRRFDECIDVMRKLWTGEVVEHHGEFFHLEPLRMTPAPNKPLPIIVGGMTPAALRRAARRGDGWLGVGQSLEDVGATLKELGRLREQEGRDKLPFEIIAPLSTQPDADSCRRLEDLAATATISYPFAYSLGPRSTLDQKRKFLETYANEVIAKVKR